jgi:hypothetical protein
MKLNDFYKKNANPLLPRITTFFSFLLVALSLNTPLKVQAQKKVPDASVRHLYSADYHTIENKLYREHIPLDGDSVNYIPFRKDKLYGFVDKKTKKLVMEPKFTQVFACYKEGAIVESDGDGYGLVDYTGKFLTPNFFPNFFKEGNLYRGIFMTSDTSMQEMYSSYLVNFYFDEQGKYLFQAKAHQFGTFTGNDSLAWFRFGERYEIYNRKGKLVKTFPWQKDVRFCGIFDNILVEEIKHGDSPGHYVGKDIKGNKKFDVPYDYNAEEVYRLSDDVFVFIYESSFTLTDAKGKDYPYGMSNEWPASSYANTFPYMREMELIPVRNEETHKMGYINKSGKLVIPCKYDYAGYFENGEAPFLDPVTHLIGFMNAREEVTVKPFITMETARQIAMESQELHFSENLCRITVQIPHKHADGEEYLETDEDNHEILNIAYTDRKGEMKLVLPDSIKLGGDFADGLAPVVGKDGGLGFIDTSGKIVIPMKYEIAVAGAYPVPFLVIPKFKNGYVYLKSFKGYLDKSGYEYFSGKQEKDHYDFSH